MKTKALSITVLILGFFIFQGCTDPLADDVEPLATAMCKYIEMQNDLKKAVDENDSLNIHLYTAECNKIQIEMTILNKKFHEKYAGKIKDREFGKKFKKEMNKFLVDCPYLSPEDRDRIKKEQP